MRVGEPMLRLGDGMQGIVEEVEEYGQRRLAIVYLDRGERVIAGKQEQWTLSGPPLPPLREEEKRAVGLIADEMLRSLVKHKPMQWWNLKRLEKGVPFDPRLVQLIVDYLGKKQ